MTSKFLQRNAPIHLAKCELFLKNIIRNNIGKNIGPNLWWSKPGWQKWGFKKYYFIDSKCCMYCRAKYIFCIYILKSFYLLFMSHSDNNSYYVTLVNFWVNLDYYCWIYYIIPKILFIKPRFLMHKSVKILGKLTMPSKERL